jgi:hypothetical protein
LHKKHFYGKHYIKLSIYRRENLLFVRYFKREKSAERHLDESGGISETNKNPIYKWKEGIKM